MAILVAPMVLEPSWPPSACAPARCPAPSSPPAPWAIAAMLVLVATLPTAEGMKHDPNIGAGLRVLATIHLAIHRSYFRSAPES
jgi:hypothetical protein